MGNEFKELQTFLSDFWSYKKDKITIDKSLDDLGMYGDDKRDFLRSFIEKFNVESSGLDYDKFCEREIFNPLRNLFFKRRSEEKIKITMQHLIDVINKKKWFEPFLEGAILIWQQGENGVNANKTWSTVGTIAFSGAAGGVTAELTGGDFLKGTATEVTIGMLNHAMHQIGNHGDTEDPPKYKYKGKIYEDKAKLYSDILIDQVAEQFGIKDILALGTAIDGMGLIDKPFQMQGASKGTSLLSKGLSKALPQNGSLYF